MCRVGFSPTGHVLYTPAIFRFLVLGAAEGWCGGFLADGAALLHENCN